MRQAGDPPPRKNSKQSNKRMGRYDGSYTPTEQRVKEKCMKQFTNLEGPSGNTDAFVNASCWDENGRLKP